MYRPLCIYHGNCADGFGAAWVVNRHFKGEVDFHPGFYGADPPDVAGRDVIMVDFSYKRPVLDAMAQSARSILILDHHKTAQEDLSGYFAPLGPWRQHLDYIHLRAAQDHIEGKRPIVHAIFDMNRSGAGLAWDYFNPNVLRPSLIDHVEDRDLWRFNLDGSAELHAALMSYPLEFDLWNDWSLERDLFPLKTEGVAITRKLKQDVAHILSVATRRMVIGGVDVPVANLPYMMASEAAGDMAENAPFAATYYDGATARHFSLRSRGADGMDVAEIAKGYGGGGHRNAAGFQMPIGWEGDAP